MAKRNLNDLLALVTVAREGSFTRAAAVLGVTQSALSQTIRALEERLDIRLLTRTTRSVAPTEAGVRLGEAVHKDMIAIPIGPRVRMAAVASPAYFAQHAPPKTPGELVRHRCINQRQAGGGFYVWEFERRRRELEVRVEGQVIVNTSPHIVAAALDGMGIAFLPEEEFAPHLEEGRLVRVLEDWCPPFPGFHLYYPSRRHPSPAFSLVLDALRIRNSG